MTRCACRAVLSEQELTAAYSLGVRIEHDAEPCLPSAESVRERYAAKNDPRPVLTRLPRLTVVGAK